jgi:glucose dehydrogenase
MIKNGGYNVMNVTNVTNAGVNWVCDKQTGTSLYDVPDVPVCSLATEECHKRHGMTFLARLSKRWRQLGL